MAPARSALLLSAALALLGLSGLGCGSSSSGGANASASAKDASAPLPPPPPSGPAAPASPTVLPAAAPGDPNPLHLAARKVNLDPGKRVFTFSEAMLSNAKLGSTLVLYASTVIGLEGDDFLVEAKSGGSYRVHPAYVIPVPDDPKLKPGDPVISEWNGVMRHGVVTKFLKDQVGVRFTDMDARLPEAMLRGGKGSPTAGVPSKAARFIHPADGLAAGNFAVLHEGTEWKHVLLVSASDDAGGKSWFCLGFGGAARIVREADLKPIPVQWSPKQGAEVWAEWAGIMRKATVQTVDETGLFTVKFERAGRPSKVGWGMLMAPLDG